MIFAGRIGQAPLIQVTAMPSPGASSTYPHGRLSPEGFQANRSSLQMGSHRRGTATLLAVAVSVVAGIALVKVPPLFVFGTAACVLSAGIILWRPYIGLLLYTVTFMLNPGQVFPVLSPLHVERVVGVVTLVAMYLEQYRVSRKIVLDGTRQTLLLLLLIVPVLISIPFAYWRFQAVDGLIDFLKLVVWYLLVVHLVSSQLRLRVYLALFLALIFYIGMDSFLAYLRGDYAVSMGIERAVGQTSIGGNANNLAGTMAVTIPVLLLLTFHGPLRWFRVLPAAGTLALTMTMAVTGSRGGLLAFLGGLAFLWWRSRHRLLVGIVGIAVLACGVYALPQQYKTRYASITNSELDSSSQGRITQWKKGLRMLADRPLTGVGISCFGSANALAYSTGSRKSYLQAHSLFVQVPAELGLVGAVVFFAFLIEVFRLSRRTERALEAAGAACRFDAIAVQGLAGGLFALLVGSVFGHSFLRHTWYVYAALTVAAARILTSSPQEAGARATSPLRS